jgi:uncharacterized membrane protein (DUF485 family)
LSHPHETDPPGISPADADDHPEIASANARAGLWLFALYLGLYSGFVGLSAFAPGLMAATPFGGLNLAVLYGMALIAAALFLALVYMATCRRAADRHAAGGEK